MYYKKDIKSIEEEFETSKDGLSIDKVKSHREKFGLNVLPKKKRDNVFTLFINEFKDPMIILLLVSILISIAVGEIVDAISIAVIILIDAIIGTVEEYKANSTADALNKLVATKVKVIRDGCITSIDAEELTVGDYVLLESGDKICADMRICEAHNFMVDESILTGESLNVEKNTEIIDKENVALAERFNMVFSGTTVITGRAKAIVVSIGLETEIGKIANTLNNTEEQKSPLTLRVEKLSKQISSLILVVAIIVAILLIVKHVPYSEIFVSVIALAVSAMPEGLPLALTMALTIASNKMAKENVIVRKLKSAESLGSCTVIASDKTGTLTVNEQTAKKIVLPDGDTYEVEGTGYSFDGEVTGYDLKRAREIALLGYINNESEVSETETVGDSIDIAFKVLGKKLNVKDKDIRIIETVPYESENKYSAVFYEVDDEVYCTVKGSLDVVKSFCSKVNLTNDKITTKKLEKQNEELASDGYRVIALANGKLGKKKSYSNKDIKGLTFMGMVGFIDPIRKEAVTSIAECHTAGIKVLMITGDHPLTAYSIAKDLKLVTDYDEVATGDDIEDAIKKGEIAFDRFITKKKVFARVTPLQKLAIVESLKRQGEFVAVTGDGVNDAPALKAANIGIAMGSGTDLARETADMIIADDNFKSIVSGIKEGRVAYANIRKIIYFLLSCGLAEVLFFTLSIVFNLPVPLVAIQLLWLNVVTDGLQDIALSFESAEDGILKEKPISPKDSIFNKQLFSEVIFAGLIIGLIVFIVWYVLIKVNNSDVVYARGYVMALMVFIQNIHVFNCRSEKKSAFSKAIKFNGFTFLAAIGSIVLQIIVMENATLSTLLKTHSIPSEELIGLFIIAFVILLSVEGYKFFTNQK